MYTSMSSRALRWSTGLLLIVISLGGRAYAQQSTEELAKAVQNPVAKPISVPFQNNTNFEVGAQKRTVRVLQRRHPDSGPTWQLRFQVQLLFPK